MKKFFAAAAFSLLLLGCVSQAQPTPSPMAPPGASCQRVIEMTAKSWEFSPSTIAVKKGETVCLRLAVPEGDATHGFSVPGLNVNEQLPPGKTTEVKFFAASAGAFDFACSVFCGTGHGGMRGKIIVSD